MFPPGRSPPRRGPPPGDVASRLLTRAVPHSAVLVGWQRLSEADRRSTLWRPWLEPASAGWALAESAAAVRRAFVGACGGDAPELPRYPAFGKPPG